MAHVFYKFVSCELTRFESGDQNVLLSFTMNNISLGENQITLFCVMVKTVIWAKTKRLILGENRFAPYFFSD